MRLLPLVVALVIAGCGSKAADDTAVVSAATSLKAALGTVGGPRFSFAGSDALAAQIRQGVRPDVFAAANTKQPLMLAADHLVGTPVNFATNRLVLAVAAKDAKVRSLAGVARPGVTVAIGAKDVPVGDYTRTALARLPRAEGQAIMRNVRSEEPDVGGVVGKIAEGAVDAGFVYVTDVRAASGRLRAIALPARVRPRVVYAAAVVRGAPHPAAAGRFLASLVSGPARRALDKAGFGRP